jgi:ATP-dependent exoDNAse (exonuclease V) beta subunit
MVFDTVRQWSANPDHQLPPVAASIGVEIVTIPVPPGSVERRGGAAFGVLVHSLLAQVPFDATRETLDDLATMEAKVLGLDGGDASAAVLTVERVLRHDLLTRARSASARDACRRETPVALTLPDGTLVEGIVDLAFEEQGKWTVVDYKTDRELASGEESYRRQVALYAAGIAAATDGTAKGVLVRV